MIFEKKILTFIFLMSMIVIHTFAQEWKVPERNKKKTAQAKFTPENIKKGELIFTTNCVACHGTPGKMNFAKITPSPGDPAGDKFQNNTDGELFFKITTGKLPMPSFKNTFAEEDRWNVISYIRSFNKKYIQPEPVKEEGTEYIVALKISHIKEKNQVLVKATSTTKVATNPEVINGVDVTLYAQRKFGILPIDKKKVTNANGEAFFSFPSDLPGDTAGIITILAKFTDEIGDFGEAEASVKLPIGKPTHVTSLIDTRAMWTIRSRAPIWLIISYCGAVLLVFGIIGYILSQLMKLRKLDSEILNKSNHE